MACLAHDEESLVFAVAIGVLLGPSRCLRSGELAHSGRRFDPYGSRVTHMGQGETHMGPVLTHMGPI
jgi:hypothetical protein